MTSTTTWRTVQRADVLRNKNCKLAAMKDEPFAPVYQLCGFCKYPSDQVTHYYVVREDGSTTFFKESDLVVQDELSQ